MEKVFFDPSKEFKESIVQYSVVVFGKTVNLLILEFPKTVNKEFLVLGMLKEKKELVELLPMLHKIVSESKANLPRRVKRPAYTYDTLLKKECSKSVLFTEEGYDYLVANYGYTDFNIEKTVELEVYQRNDRKSYQIKREDQINSDEFEGKFYTLESLDQNYGLNERHAKYMNHSDLIRFIKENKKKLAFMFSNRKAMIGENDYQNTVPSTYQRELNLVTNKMTYIEKFAYKYYLEKFRDIFYDPIELVNMQDKELKKYIVKNLNMVMNYINFNSDEKEALNYFTSSGDKANLIINKITLRYVNDWFDPIKTIDFSTEELESFVDKHKEKILTLMENDDPKYIKMYNHAKEDTISARKILIFYIDYTSSKRYTEFQNQLMKLDEGEENDREIRKVKL